MCICLLVCLAAVPVFAEGEGGVPEESIPSQWQQMIEEAPMTQQEFQNQTAQGWLTLAGSALKKAAGAPILPFFES